MLAVISFGCVLFRWYRELWITGVGLADIAVQSVQLQWGWAVLVIRIVHLIAAAAMKDTAKEFAL